MNNKALLKAHPDVLRVLPIFQRIALESQEACFIAVIKRADLAIGEDGSGRGFGPHLEQRQVVEYP